MTRVLLALLVVFGVSCTIAARQTVRPDGTREQQLFAQGPGGKGAYVGTADGGMVVQADNEKSFGQFVGAAAGTAIGLGYFSAEKATTAANAATAQNAARTQAATEQARIQATERAATTLGSNPEANTGAINAAGNLFR